MTTAYELEIQAHCPQAEIVHDLFHVVAKHDRKVIDRVRADQANPLRQDRPTRRVIKNGVNTQAKHSGIVEVINNTIKVIKRRAYAYRNYLFLKIRVAFPDKDR